MAAYYRPTQLEEALIKRAETKATIAAGCTDLFPATQAKSLNQDILDVTAIEGLRGIRQHDEGWRIGANTRWSDIIAQDLPPCFDGLKQAAAEVGSVQIQNAGTLAGNLCTASPAGDGAPCLLTLDAEVELRSMCGTRLLPLDEFLISPRRTALGQSEILTAIEIPITSGNGAFLKLGARRYLVISIAMVALRIEVQDGVIRECAVAVGSCSPTAVRLPVLEKTLIGAPIMDAAEAVHRSEVAQSLDPIDDIRADGPYRIDAAVTLIQRGLADMAKAEAHR